MDRVHPPEFDPSTTSLLAAEQDPTVKYAPHPFLDVPVTLMVYIPFARLTSAGGAAIGVTDQVCRPYPSVVSVTLLVPAEQKSAVTIAPPHPGLPVGMVI